MSVLISPLDSVVVVWSASGAPQTKWVVALLVAVVIDVVGAVAAFSGSYHLATIWDVLLIPAHVGAAVLRFAAKSYSHASESAARSPDGPHNTRGLTVGNAETAEQSGSGRMPAALPLPSTLAGVQSKALITSTIATRS